MRSEMEKDPAPLHLHKIIYLHGISTFMFCEGIYKTEVYKIIK